MPSKPILVAALAIGAGSLLVTAQQPDPLPALAARVERLQARLDSIESVRTIKRTQYAEIPPRVVYEWTPRAESLRPVFEAILEWGEASMTTPPWEVLSPRRISGPDMVGSFFNLAKKVHRLSDC